MLDLFENGNYRRRRRRRNVKRETREKRSAGEQNGLSAFSSTESGFSGLSCSSSEKTEPQPKALEPSELFPSAAANQESLNTSSVGKSDSEIKFSIDYILSAPDPLPALRSPYHAQDSKLPFLDSPHISLQFWTM